MKKQSFQFIRGQLGKQLAFMRDNLPTCAAFLFLFVAGLASGITTTQLLYGDVAATMVEELPAAFGENSINILRMFLVALCLNGITGLVALLCTLWLPFLLFWPIMLFIRAFLLGCGLFCCICALPCWSAIVLLFMLQIETAVLLPCLLKLYALSGHSLLSLFRSETSQRQLLCNGFRIPEISMSCAGLLLCSIIEGIIAPILLRAFVV